MSWLNSHWLQYKDLVKSTQNRAAHCLSILWSLGQVGVTSLKCGLKGRNYLLETWMTRFLQHGKQRRPSPNAALSGCPISDTFEPPHHKTSIMIYAPSEDLDQPGHLPSLFRVFAVRVKKHWALNYLLSAQWRLIRLGGCPGCSESSLSAHAILLVLSCSRSFCDVISF